MSGAVAAMLPDGRRLHLQHGPIDLVIEAFGSEAERGAAYRQAAERFATVLEELVAELPALRRPCEPGLGFEGVVARRMAAAVAPYASEQFVTPMAAVAGAVADEILAALCAGRRLERAYVNNGGDIALHLAPGATLTLAVHGHGADLAEPRRTLRAEDPIRGIATSGWRGRSHSLGVADAVTVSAASAAMADVAATLIANAVDLPGSPKITRVPASELSPDSDLGDRPVTTDVAPLTEAEAEAALARGAAAAEAAIAAGRIHDAALFLAGRHRILPAGSPALT